MSKFTDRLQTKVVPVIGKVASVPYIVAITKAFSAFLPLVLIGSFTLLLGQINISWYQTFLQNSTISTAFYMIYYLSIGLFSIWTAFSLGYNYANALKMNSSAFNIGIINLFCFLIVTPFTMIDGAAYLPFESLGAQGVFTVLLLTPLVVRIYKFCMDHNIRIKMPDTVPPYMANSISSIIPALIAAAVSYVFLRIAQLLGYTSLTECIYKIIGMPLMMIADKPWGTFFMFTLGLVFQSCFGIHGNVVLSIVAPILTPMAIENAAAYMAGNPIPHMYSMSFFVFMEVQVVAHVILLLTSKKKRFKELGKLCAFPAVFTVTEPVNFGVPMVFNPYLLIPNLLIPFINFTVLSLMMFVGFLPYCHGIYTWGLPILFNAYMQSGVMGIVAQLLIIALDVLLMWPFFKIFEKNAEENI